ncbi:MAG: methyltransferase [Solirubrobacterales bacterium]
MRIPSPISFDRPPPTPAVQAVLGVRRLLRWAGDRVLPPELLAWERTMGIATARAVGALVEVGAIEALGRAPATADAVAAELDLDADTLERVLRLGAADGLLKRRSDRTWELTAAGRTLLESHSPSISYWARYMETEAVQRAWAGLAGSIRTGEPAFPAVHGRSFWDHLAANPDEQRLFANSMREMTGLVKAWVASGYDWPDAGTVCDVAGGSGPLLAAILEARPGLRGVLVEAPGVLPEADAHLREAGVRDRVELVAGNIFERVEAEADLYLLKDILHDWDDERSLRILETVRRAMSTGARLILVETLLDPDDPDPVAVLVDLQMLTQCDGGRQRSAEELQALLSSAGLRPGAVHRTGSPALVEGIA